MSRSTGSGYIHVYTGDGKGKTTAALGLTLRALGAGIRVFFAQFLKKGEFSEIKALRCFGEEVVVRQYGSGRFIRGRPAREDKALAERGLDEVKRAMMDGRYGLIVMDELNVALYMEVLPLRHVLGLLDARPGDAELVITGRRAPAELLARADLVTEMVKVKHYFDQGVRARRGIES